MKALDRKLLRDLLSMKGQVIAIAMIIVSGVSTFVMFISTMNSLNLTRDKFYREYGFADVFAPMKRAPESLKQRIAEIPGVDRIETRISSDLKLDIKGFPEPVTAKLVSVPDDGTPLLNRLYIREGRMPDPLKDDEVLVSDAFAEAHRFKPGDRFGAVINGKWKTLVIVGTALSPEYVLQVRPGALSPDYKRYGILWMGRSSIETAYDMKGAFNDIAITLSPDTRVDDVLVQLDNIIDRYGGLGSYGRKDQMSHRYLSEEFRQLQRSAEIYPSIFIAVSAFLLNVVIARVISTQREQIAALKAFGYSNIAVGIHYAKLVLMIVLIGVTGGIIVGVWLGKGLGNIYMEFYRFPYFIYELRPSVITAVSLISILSALSGTIHSVYRASKLPPAEAMRPEPPTNYRKTMIERMAPVNLFSQPSRIIIRNIERRPVRALFSVTGIAMACAIMIAGGFFEDAVDFMVDVQFKLSQKEDMTVTFIEPTSRKSSYELKGIEGIEYVEAFRSVPARVSLSERSRELASLRVLGYTRAEISYILLGELGILTITAIPIGFVIGRALCAYITRALESDLFRIPLTMEPSTYSLAAAVVLVSAGISGLIVRHRLDHLDLVAVLKTKE